jgi:organic radical activating enzyme
LAELLYIAYNRDEAELYQLSKALDSQFDALYSTGKDVIEKQQERIDQEINATALDLATSSIIRADRLKQQEELKIQLDKDQKVKTKAMELLDNYENQLDPRTYQLAKEQVEIEMDPIIQQDRLNIAGKPAQEQLDSRRIVTKKSENTNPNVGQPVNQPNAAMNNTNQVNPNANIMGNN